MTPTTWHKITSDKRTVEPADGKARVWVRNGNGRAPRQARWDGHAREWYWNTGVDWRASWACYPEWCEWDGHAPAPEPVAKAERAQMGMGL